MASLPGTRFDITGASGSQGLLSPKSSWRAFVLPRGGHASQDSTGTLLTFDSASVASRFAVGNWIQAGLSPANVRQVGSVGGNSLNVSGAALTVSENTRIFLIGNSEPTVAGTSVTYITPNTLIRQRDDDAADLYTNSMVTSNADGLVQFFAATNLYDCIIQDGNQGNQGSIINLPVGVVEGVSVSTDALFGASLTINGALGVTGWATFGQTATFNATIGVTGWATFGSTVTMNASAGVTGSLTIGGTATFTARATFGASTIFNQGVGFTGAVTLSGGVTSSALFGSSVGILGRLTVGQSTTILGQTSSLIVARIGFGEAAALAVSNFTLGNSWGTGATITLATCNDMIGRFIVSTGSASFGAQPDVILTHRRTHPSSAVAVATRAFSANEAQPTVQWASIGSGALTIFHLMGTPSAGQTFSCNYMVIDSGSA